MTDTQEDCAATPTEDFVRRFMEDLRDPFTALQTHERGPCGGSRNWGDASKAAILARLLSAESNEAELTSLRSQNKGMREAFRDWADKWKQISNLVELHDNGALGVEPFRLAVAKLVKLEAIQEAALSPTSKEETENV